MSEQTSTFADLAGVHPKTALALSRAGIHAPFPVQAAVVPLGIRGRDVLVQSPTGSGKTLAYGIPIIEQLKAGSTKPGALILVPTRELAMQVTADLAPIAMGKQLACVAVYGGAPVHVQARAVQTAAIVIATPGRLDDLRRSRCIDLSQVKVLVLDEADRMLDMGFQPQVDEIVQHMPTKRQTLLFSATLEGKVAQVAASYARDPEVVVNDSVPGAGGEIDHQMMQTTTGTKVDTILDVLDTPRDLTVIFVRTQAGADRLNDRLREYGVRSTVIHGGMNQSQRTREYRRFQQGSADTLVATDVFARGMDLDRITLVINYDIPEDADTYRHRAGRTGRAGRVGTAVTMFAPNQRRRMRSMVVEAGHDPKLVDSPRTPTGKRWHTVPIEDRYRGTEYVKPEASDRPERSGRPERGRGGKFERGGRPERSSKFERGSKPTFGKPSHGKPSRAAVNAGPGDGTVASYDPKKGFGFITPDAGGSDVFFHRNKVNGTDPATLRNGMRVAFGTETNDRGPRADNVRVVGGAPSRPERPARPSRPAHPNGKRPHGGKPAYSGKAKRAVPASR